MKKILIFTDYYYPAKNAGGPVKSISNIVLNLGQKYKFYIVTRNHDLNISKPFTTSSREEWLNVGNAKVKYLTLKYLNIFKYYKLLSLNEYDLIYLNSFFSVNFTIPLLVLKFIGFIPKINIIIAPRGELSCNALKLKKIKKYLFIKVAKFMGLYNQIIWHATSLTEKNDITNSICQSNINVVGNIVSNVAITNSLNNNLNNYLLNKNLNKNDRSILRIIFLSRIVVKKNLIYLLDILKENDLNVHLSIYGNIEDKDYWNRCCDFISSNKLNQIVSYKGALDPKDVINIFQEHDVFFFPTMSENFGHVILESLQVGTNVVVSDNTPWKQNNNKVIEVLPLSNKTLWRQCLLRWLDYTDLDKLQKRKKALAYYLNFSENDDSINKMNLLFDRAIKNKITNS